MGLSVPLTGTAQSADGVASISYRLSSDGGSTFGPSVPVSIIPGPSAAFSQLIPDLAAGSYLARITVTGRSGGASSIDRAFTVEAVPAEPPPVEPPPTEPPAASDVTDWYGAWSAAKSPLFSTITGTGAVSAGSSVGMVRGLLNTAGQSVDLLASANDATRPTLVTDGTEAALDFTPASLQKLVHNFPGGVAAGGLVTLVTRFRFTALPSGSLRILGVTPVGSAQGSYDIHRSSSTNLYARVNNQSASSAEIAASFLNTTTVLTIIGTFDGVKNTLYFVPGSDWTARTVITTPFEAALGAYANLFVGSTAALAAFTPMRLRAARVYQRALTLAELEKVFNNL